ncbi:MAG: type II secretion system ATPase GspE [bacterium]
MPRKKKPIGQLLLEKGLITSEQLEHALNEQQKSGGLLGRILVDLGFVTEADILSTLGAQTGMPAANLPKIDIPPEVLGKVSAPIAKVYKIIPVKMEENILYIAMSDPLNINVLDDLRFMLECEVRGMVSNEKDIEEAIFKYYGEKTETVQDVLKEMETGAMEIKGSIEDEDEDVHDVATLQELAHQVPVVKLLNLVLIQAIKDKASDLHFEPFEDQFKIRYRVDGMLYEMIPPPRHLALAVTSRIKVMAGMDIAERRLPQDGRIQLNMGGREVDLRISTLPTTYGESVVIRILDRGAVMLSLEQVGLLEEDLRILRDLIKKPNGIILVTGPTGCGKTTTLYSALGEINSPEDKIITTEDPVEYDLAGIIQVQIRSHIGLTFSKCLRSILRQDPDKILVGEIRDLETAEMSIQASLTGHLVLSTLHTNDAASTIVRLIDMDIEPFLITSTLEAIIAQRLVRKICSSCKEEYSPDAREFSLIGLKSGDAEGKKFYRGKGCEICNGIGYKGRIGIFEILVVNDEIRTLIVDKATAGELRKKSHEKGMSMLREDGLRKIYMGITTIEEVARETQGVEI